MSGDPGARRILPQSSHMQSFSFAPNNVGPRENQKNYVFVDEHNRHKRLKVMRACEGCRRRKIKCDAATTNTWPCSACIRLKLHCIPPTVNYDSEFPNNPQDFGLERGDYETGVSAEDEYHHQLAMQQQFNGPEKHISPIYTQQIPFTDMGMYHTSPYGEPTAAQQLLHYDTMPTPVSALDQHQPYPTQPVFSTPPMQQSHADSPDTYEQDQFGQQDLVDLLGELRMDERGVAPYLNNKNKAKTLDEEPAFEEIDEYNHVLPSTLSGPDMKVRIPPELMPDDETILSYFDLYFANVHPYVPVLNKALFYQQWHTNRDSISPLILEAIFAIAGRLADEPAQGQQWLALAGKHADSFMDIPRLSTLQAMLIVLKARESAPKRGYYYRSWMSIEQCAQMGKDLGLDEHYEDHQAGKPCGSNTSDCAIKTRIWQTTFVCELMIGAPQGRTDLTVDIDTLDLTIARSVHGSEDSEQIVTRNFTYFARIVSKVRTQLDAYARIRKKKDWGIDPEIVQLNPIFESWQSDLPSDLQVTFPPDGSPPWLSSHYIGNLHSYYHLSIIMLHRPQLTFMEPSGPDGGWKKHMLICYSSAKLLCRLQEGVMQLFGMTGLLCMQRGINLTIYCILTCTVLHLVALTSPDPDLNEDAREYFTRHMRILEKCTSSWPMPDMQQQIDALREAFSADMRKPFVLKPSFPYGSPGAPLNKTPPRMNTSNRHPTSNSPLSTTQTIQQHVSYTSHPISPPVSAGGADVKGNSSAVNTMAMMPSGHGMSHQSLPSGIPMVDSSAWNPAVIFDRWNTTFGTPAQSAPPPTQPPLRLGVSGSQDISGLSEMHVPNVSLTPTSQPLPQQQYSAAQVSSFVSPSMWQESVASVWEIGQKRAWDFDDGTDLALKRPR